MKKINITTFLSEYLKVLAKLEEIDKIPRWGVSDNRCFDAIDIDEHDNEFIYKTEEITNCPSPDTFWLRVKFDEINQPLSYFEEKFAKEIERLSKLTRK